MGGGNIELGQDVLHLAGVGHLKKESLSNREQDVAHLPSVLHLSLILLVFQYVNL